MHFLKPAGLLLFVSVLTSTGVSLSGAEGDPLLIGESVCVCTLADDNTEVRGMAFDGASASDSRLYCLDGSGRIFAYRFQQEAVGEREAFELVHTYDLSGVSGGSRLASPRGLAFAVESGRKILYFLNWDHSGGVTSQLWRYDVEDNTAAHVDLSLHTFRIGDREVLDLACEDGQLLVSFDASAYADQNLRVQRGILRIAWNGELSENPASVRHLPDAGTLPSRGLACMPLDGARYLWATIGNDHIYCADARTGRGLFFFDRPKSTEDSDSCWGLCFGRNALWVSEHVAGADRVHRVNVTKNLDAFYVGPRVPRRLVMTIRSDPESESADPGTVFHTYSRPYRYEQLHNQGIWPDTEAIVDVSSVPNAIIRELVHDPAGDTSSRQIMQCVEYANAPAGRYSSRYEIDLWTNPYRKFVYPHRANRCCGALEDMDYLADDPELYNLSDKATYAAFIKRVASHIERKYGIQADMENPYWAARNVVEYIQDSYYYPSRPKRKPATVDYDRGHYDANPGNLKIELSAREYDASQIIACSGTSVMVAGAMRHLGIPARWLGTGTQHGSSEWDSNGNGLLDAHETASCSNGHRYTQVWLGEHYGWVCFDATPSKPDLNDYDPPPPLRSQWRYMHRAAAGHREERRIVFNVGSGLIRPLYRDFEYDESLAMDNNCGGDQRYNLQGRFEKPELWKLPRHRIGLKNLCFITDVAFAGSGSASQVTWKLEGAWHRIPNATVTLVLQQKTAGANSPKDIAKLAKAIPADAGSTTVDLSGYRGKQFRILIRRDGDPETGGQSEWFEIE